MSSPRRARSWSHSPASTTCCRWRSFSTRPSECVSSATNTARIASSARRSSFRSEARKELVALAREYDVLPVAIVLDPPERVCVERNEHRADRQFGAKVVVRQRSQLKRGLRSLKREGFRTVHVLTSVDEIDAVSIERT